MICYLCERPGDRSTLVGALGDYAHPECIEAKHRAQENLRLRSEETRLREENARLRERIVELEHPVAPRTRVADPYDPDGGEDDVRCPNRGRLIRGH